MIAEVIVLDVSIALALAWKLRWAVIKSTNSLVRSTFDRSVAPARKVPKPAEPAVPSVALPEAEEAKKKQSESKDGSVVDAEVKETEPAV